MRSIVSNQDSTMEFETYFSPGYNRCLVLVVPCPYKYQPLQTLELSIRVSNLLLPHNRATATKLVKPTAVTINPHVRRRQALGGWPRVWPDHTECLCVA